MTSTRGLTGRVGGARAVIALALAACGGNSQPGKPAAQAGAAKPPLTAAEPSAAAAPAGGAKPAVTAAPAEPSAAAAGPAGEPFAPPAAKATASAGCELLAFAETTPVPEASGAAWLTVDGKLALLVTSDSGNRGAYGLVDPETGATFETGALPLSDEASDDTEGMAIRGEDIYGLTSSGWIRRWQRKPGGFALVETYPLGPIESGRDAMVCKGRSINCGRNYEGICLANRLAHRPRSPDCIGFAAAKADGRLYCLSDQAGRLVVQRDRAIAVTRPGALADCAFSDDDTLWAGTNMFDLGRAYRIARWAEPAAAQVEDAGILAVGFAEVIAARGDVVYRMSDTGGAPSAMARFRCRR